MKYLLLLLMMISVHCFGQKVKSKKVHKSEQSKGVIFPNGVYGDWEDDNPLHKLRCFPDPCGCDSTKDRIEVFNKDGILMPVKNDTMYFKGNGHYFIHPKRNDDSIAAHWLDSVHVYEELRLNKSVTIFGASGNDKIGYIDSLGILHFSKEDSLTHRIDSLQSLCDSLNVKNDKLLKVIRDLIEVNARNNRGLDGIKYSFLKPKLKTGNFSQNR